MQKIGETKGSELLFNYIVDNALSYRTAGEQLGIAFPTICRIVRGNRNPTYEHMEKIARWSGGAIRPEHWFQKRNESNESETKPQQ
jgi:transcriptional regulator with XRE-family HTH domain